MLLGQVKLSNPLQTENYVINETLSDTQARRSKWLNSKTTLWILLKFIFNQYFMVLNYCAVF